MPGWETHTGATWDGLRFFSNSFQLPIGSTFSRARPGLCFISSFWGAGGVCHAVWAAPSHSAEDHLSPSLKPRCSGVPPGVRKQGCRGRGYCLPGGCCSLGAGAQAWAWASDRPGCFLDLAWLPVASATLGSLVTKLLEPQFPQVRWAGRADGGTCHGLGLE